MLEKFWERKVLFAAMFGIVSLLCILGYMAANYENPLVRDYCAQDKALIARYNGLVREQGVSKLTSISGSLAKKKIDQDATCLYMQMVVEYGDMKTSNELETYKKLKALEQSGQKVSGDINDGLDRTAIEKLIQKQLDENAAGVYGSG